MPSSSHAIPNRHAPAASISRMRRTGGTRPSCRKLPVSQPPRHRAAAEMMQRGPSGSNVPPCRLPGSMCASSHELTEPEGVKSPPKNWSRATRARMPPVAAAMAFRRLSRSTQVPPMAQERPMSPSTDAYLMSSVQVRGPLTIIPRRTRREALFQILSRPGPGPVFSSACRDSEKDMETPAMKTKTGKTRSYRRSPCQPA